MVAQLDGRRIPEPPTARHDIRKADGKRGQVRLALLRLAYQIGVQVASKSIAGVIVHQIAHTEAADVIHETGHKQALLMWPFAARDVEQTLVSLHGA